MAAGGFSVGHSYRCDDDGITGYNMSSSTFNNYPVYSFVQNIFRAGVTYTCLDKRMGYAINDQEIGSEIIFCLMDNGYWIAQFNAGSFTYIS